VFAAVAALVILGVAMFRNANEVPSFPKLADTPDTTLTGTVAYSDYRCLRVVDMSGAVDREVVCGVGGEATPYIDEVVWLADGRLQATSYSATPRWRTIYDIETGTSESVPADQVPASPSSTSVPTTNASDEQLAVTNDSGHAVVTATGPSGARTLLDVTGGSLYEVGAPGWSADESVVLVHDSADRILLITTGDEPTTRVLAAPAAQLWGSTVQGLLAGGS
jgi:hypothetical protein